MKSYFIFFAITMTCVVFTTQAFAQSLFSGLTVTERKEGLSVVDTQPGNPAYYAGLKAGDTILEIDGRQVKTIEDYLKISREVKSKKVETSLTILRGGSLYEAILKIYSVPINQQWGLKVTKPIELAKGVTDSAFKYWTSKGRTTLEETVKIIPFEKKVKICNEAITCFFNALHYRIGSIDTALLIAKLYQELGILYLNDGDIKEGIKYYKYSIKLNTGCLKKTKEEDYLRLILTNLKGIDKKLSKIDTVKPQITNNKQQTITPNPNESPVRTAHPGEEL